MSMHVTSVYLSTKYGLTRLTINATLINGIYVYRKRREIYTPAACSELRNHDKFAEKSIRILLV